jgi:uncharacterized protein (TIGR03118 family)
MSTSHLLKKLLVGLTLLLLHTTTFAQHYQQTNLVSDLAGMAAITDANLKNPWGLARSASSPWWVSNNNSGTATLYDGTGNPFPAATPLIVSIPASSLGSGAGTPTGVVFNGSSDFSVAPGKPGIFIFATEDGTIAAWNPGVNGSNAVIKVNNSPNAVYKGLTINRVNGSHFLYVANFRSGQVEVYDTNFQLVAQPRKAFRDRGLPKGYAPFNIQSIGTNLVVAFAKQDAAKHDNQEGAGLGFVDVFSPSGALLVGLEQGSWLDAPWGIAFAPGDFGAFSHALLVGNFGSGQIAAYNPITAQFLGMVKNADDSVMTIEGLWSLSFGNSANAGPYDTLFFSAGIQGEQHGLFGTITPVPAELSGDEPSKAPSRDK